MNNTQNDIGTGSANQHSGQPDHAPEQLERYINLKLAALGLPVCQVVANQELHIARDLLAHFRQKNRLLMEYQCPVDQRVQSYLNSLFSDADLPSPHIPTCSFILDRQGLARTMSLPPDKDEFINENISSYRISQGILNNPKNDRRTTKGSFHVAEGGLPVPPDKKAVPLETFNHLLAKAFDPPEDLSLLPFTSNQNEQAHAFVSLLLKPIVCPEVPGFSPSRYMEVRFFAPGSLVSNLDFVESIFGNAGDPYLPENDSGLDPEHWSGHTGFAILAPHLTRLTKKELGLPHVSRASERQKMDGMCWEKEDELYNEGSPFKITSRDIRGVIVTIIADNYFGYSKKEIKTQISYAANLSGLYEEEHAGGALAFASFNLGVHYSPDSIKYDNGQTFEEAIALLGDEVQVFPEGYAVHKQFPSIFILPENARLFVDTQEAQWQWQGKDQKMRILPGKVYVHPSGYKIHLEKHPATPAWRLVGTEAEGVFCHKPCTVSGGGKSEISKSIWDAIRFEPIFVADFESDMQEVAKILERSYDDRLDPSIPVEKMPAEAFPRFGASSESLSRPNGLLDPAISLGFVIHLLSPASIWCDAYNEWVNSIPNNIKMLVFLVKRFYRPSWGEDWQSHFSVNTVNGKPGNEIRYAGRNLIGSYLRIGSRGDGSGWTYKMRQDCMPAIKVQMEDDISASIVVPSSQLENLNPKYDNPSVKIAENCEHRLFQRPDDAIHRGYDKQAEQDLSLDGNFICNFAPLEQKDAIEMTELAVTFSNYTQPMQQLIAKMAEAPEQSYFVASSHPRIVDGEPSKNPRYLQLNPNLKQPRDRCLADLGARLSRRIPHGKPVYHPVNAVLPGRRNNPADPESGIRPLAVYNPIHYQELPELFMDFVASLTGKSPSTTGAGTEGALTKAPFNALVATSDLNNALLSYILTGYNAYTTAAGYIGRRFRIDHDVSLLIPELWCRMSPQELDPQRLISLGYLEPIEDFEYQGRLVPASRLGYRITHEFCNAYFGRVFDHPETIFHKEMLRPELQSLEDFVDGIENIVEAQQKVARAYLADGSVEAAIPPLKALLHIMAEGSYEGKTVHNPEIRSLFTRDYVIRSEWYAERLRKQQEQHISHCEHHITYLNGFLAHSHNLEKELQQEMKSRLKKAQQDLDRYKQKDYLNSLVGTLGLDPLFR